MVEGLPKMASRWLRIAPVAVDGFEVAKTEAPRHRPMSGGERARVADAGYAPAGVAMLTSCDVHEEHDEDLEHKVRADNELVHVTNRHLGTGRRRAAG